MHSLNKQSVHATAKEFLALVARFLTEKNALAVRRAIAMWVSGLPSWHAQLYWKRLRLAPLRQSALELPHGVLQGAMRRFRKELSASHQVLILINDARLFFPRPRNATIYHIFFYRKTLQSEANYLILFQMINTAALASKNWESFRARYRKSFEKLITTNAFFRSIAYQMGHELRHLAKDTSSVVFVDTGFQATYALFLAECLKRLYADLHTDIRLLCVYPWLAHLFSGRAHTDDARFVAALEKIAGRVMHRSDVLQKATGTFVGFAVGNALGYPAAGVTEEDFLSMHGKRIDGLTTLQQHPFFTRLGNYSDDTRLFLGVIEDLLRRGKYDYATRIATLKKWAYACASKKYFARMPGRTTFLGAMRLLEGVSPERSGSRIALSSACVHRAIPLALFFADEKESIVAVEKETALTHNTDLCKAGSVFVALLVRFLSNDNDPHDAARKALAGIVRRYGHAAQALIRPLRDAISNRIPITEAVAYFRTGPRICETVPLALYYFLQFPNIFRTPVLLAANSFRRDSPQEKERLARYSWAEQIIYADGGNTNGIAALVGAFLGAYNGLQIIDEEFFRVQDFKKLCQLGGAFDRLRSARRI